MSSTEFKVPVQNSDAADYTPITTLPEHLEQYAKISADLREKMTPVMKMILELTDKSVLRCAARPDLV